jgi:two-component system probable response regulator PhcQ
MPRIMLVDDEPNVLRALERLLASPQLEIECFDDPEQALRRIHTATFDLVLSDFRMPRLDGVELLKQIRVMQPDAMRLILSAHTDLQAILSAINEAEIYRFIAKPWDPYDLKRTIDQALAHRAMLVENRRLAQQVRNQQEQISRQEMALRELERSHPEIARVVWGEDGSVLLDQDPTE